MISAGTPIQICFFYFIYPKLSIYGKKIVEPNTWSTGFSKNPCTEGVLTLNSKGSVADGNKALEALRVVQHVWKSLAAIQRGGCLHKMADVFENRFFFFLKTLTKYCTVAINWNFEKRM